MRMHCQYVMDEPLLALGHMREFPAIATAVSIADILAPSAQPYRVVLEVHILVIVQVTAVQVVFLSPIVIRVFAARRISESQARLRPPHIFLRPVDLVEHHSLIESVHQLFPGSLVFPERALAFGAGVVFRFRVAHAPSPDRLQLSEIPHNNYRYVPESVLAGAQKGLAEEAALRLL
ncbi:hypothetical protein N9L19_00740 [bacterium]|nr:hypothetical protein [bacterium]